MTDLPRPNPGAASPGIVSMPSNCRVEAIHAIATIGHATSFSGILPDLLEIAAAAIASDQAGLLLHRHGAEGCLELAGEFHTANSRGIEWPCGQGMFASPPDRAWPHRELAAPDRERLPLADAADALLAPLCLGDRHAGWLWLARTAETCYTPDEVRLAEILAAAIARRMEQEQELLPAHDLALINELGRLVAQDMELAPVLAAGVRILSLITGAPNCFLLLLDGDKRLLRLAASTVAGAEVEEFVIPLETPSAAASALRERRPILVDNPQANPIASQRLAMRFGHHGLLAVPLIASGQPIGSIVLGETRAGRRFSSADVERAVALTHQVAAAVANARLFDDLRHSYRALARAQEELVKRERLAALGELSAAMAHEVRNPVAVIFNSLASLRRILHPTSEAQMLLDIVREEADRLNRIVGDLLDFARPKNPDIQSEPLGPLLEGAIEAASIAVGNFAIDYELHQHPGLTEAAFDARLMRQALVNLIVNAGQSMARGGKIVVSTQRQAQGGQDGVCLAVSDSGPGIPPELTERVFQPFYTTKAAGTGLGLAVVKGIVEAHRGTITLDLSKKQGATFVLWLPSPPPT